MKNIFSLGLSIAKAEFKLKNEGTWLGILWYLLSPILTFLLLLKIFYDRLGSNIPEYPIYLLLGIILFNYFQKISDECVCIIRDNASIVKSINFPREGLISAVVFKTLFAHVFEVIVLMFCLIVFGVSLDMMIFYPVILLFLSIFSFGTGLILASLGTHFFDLNNIWGFVVKLIWLGTPIFYAIEGQARLGILNVFNPMFYFITVARDIIIYHRMPQAWIGIGAVGYSVFFLCVGIVLFGRLKRKVAELV